MILIFIGPPFAGKDTQTKLLSEKLHIPVFSMGAIIRAAYAKGDPRAVKGFEEYSMKGLHVPDDLKFPLLKEKMDSANGGFILDNFPGSQEDVTTFNTYAVQNKLTVDAVFLVNISEEEMYRRMTARGRKDDTKEIVMKRREIQDLDREAVISYYKEKGILHEINGEESVADVHAHIVSVINTKND